MKCISTLSLETVFSTLLVLVFYCVFFYWYANRNRKIDVYVKPTFLCWQVRTILLGIGISLVLYAGLIDWAFYSWIVLPMSFLLDMIGIQSSLTILSLLLISVLFFVVVWPAPALLFLITAPFALSPIGRAFAPNGYQIYLLVICGVIPVLLSLISSTGAAVDALELRIREVDEDEAADFLVTDGKIGLGGIFWGLILPGAVFVRWVRRGTKTGKIRVSKSRLINDRGTFQERFIEVILPEMSTD